MRDQDGRYLNPFWIFKGVHVQSQWFPDEDDDFGNEDDSAWHSWLVSASPNGWTSHELALVWLREIFIPESAPEDPEQWHLLILDGHSSHTTDEFMITCLDHKIWVLYLPAHTSHILQPLDLGLFYILKRRFRTEITIRSRHVAFRPYNIAKGWKATGIYPRDIDKPLNSKLQLRGATQPEVISSQESTSQESAPEDSVRPSTDGNGLLWAGFTSGTYFVLSLQCRFPLETGISLCGGLYGKGVWFFGWFLNPLHVHNILPIRLFAVLVAGDTPFGGLMIAADRELGIATDLGTFLLRGNVFVHDARPINTALVLNGIAWADFYLFAFDASSVDLIDTEDNGEKVGSDRLHDAKRRIEDK
ncbi:transposase [Apiospora arundinis]